VASATPFFLTMYTAKVEVFTRRSILAYALLSCAVPAVAHAQDTLYAQGRAAIDTHRWEEAASLMAQAEAASPGTTDALLFEGSALLHLNRLPEADKALTDYVAHHSDSAAALYTLGLVQQRENKPRESLATLTHAAQVRPPTSEELRIVGFDYVLLDDYTDAIHWLEKSVAFDERNTEAWYALARAYYTQSRFRDAETAFQKTLTLDPKNEKAIENLGLVYYAENRLVDAEKAFRSAVALAHDNPHSDEWPYLNYGSFLLDQDRAQEAVPLLRQAVIVNPKSAACQEKLGRALNATGDGKEGIAHLEEAVSLSPNDAHLHYELGLAYRKAGMQDRAREQLALSGKLYGTKTAGEPK
jgi:Flp pilus assembly protein TadD